MRRLVCGLTLCGWAALAGFSPAAELEGLWPQWRGPERDGIAPDKGLKLDWTNDGPKLLWQSSGVGRGYSSVSVVGERLFTVGDRDRSEYLFCCDLQNGNVLWEALVGNAGSGGAAGSRSTPTVDGDRVYVIGTQGDLLCVKALDGDVLWKKNFAQDWGGRMMSGWGFSESPLIDGEKLVCTPGGSAATIVAVNKLTGKEIWRSAVPNLGQKGGDGAGYSSIVISNARKVKQYVQLIGRGVVSVAAKDGRPLWGYNRVANGTANIPTPIVSGDYVFCSTGYGTGAALLKVIGTGTKLDVKEEYWLEASTFQNHHGGMILVGTHVYAGIGHNNGFPTCLNLKTGKIAWTQGRHATGRESAAIAYADGHLFFRFQNGVMALIEATPEGYRDKGSFRIPNVRDPSWAHPVVAGGRLYLREQDEIYCYDLK